MTDRELELKSPGSIAGKFCVTSSTHAARATPATACPALDILNVLYNRVLRVSPTTFGDPARDRFIQSKGHSVWKPCSWCSQIAVFSLRPNSKHFASIVPISSAIPPLARFPASSKTPARSAMGRPSLPALLSRANWMLPRSASLHAAWRR